MQMSEEEMRREFAARRAIDAAANTKLQNVPAKYRQFAQAFVKDSPGGPPVMDLAKKARPEERAALIANGWDGVSPLPIDVANQLQLVGEHKAELQRQLGVDISTTEEALEKMAEQASLSIDNLEITPIADVDDPAVLAKIDHIQSPETDAVFQGILSTANRAKLAGIVEQASRKVAPMVYDSKQTQPPPAAAASPPSPPPPPARVAAPMPPPKINRAVPPPLPTTPVREMAPPPPAPPPPPPPPIPQAAPTPEPAKHDPLTCPRCNLDMRQPYKIEPTTEDLTARTVSFGSKIQGGDGRFRKTYQLFGKFKITFRELLASELKYIWIAETSPIYSQIQPGQDRAAAMILVDRINLRRHICGLDKLVNAADGQETVFPPLSSWIEQAQDDGVPDSVEVALQRMEDYVRSCYSVESVMMASGRAWNHFEELVGVLWNNQDFYEGTR